MNWGRITTIGCLLGAGFFVHIEWYWMAIIVFGCFLLGLKMDKEI